MPRLVAFGCSFTYGHSLPDCVGELEDDGKDFGRPGDLPSQYAWPNLLAEKLGYDCLNLSVIGTGNYQILIDILRTDFKQDDVVIIGYSYFNRYDYYQMIDRVDQGVQIKYEDVQHRKKINRSMLTSVLSNLNIQNYDEKMYWNNWLSIQHAEMLLNYKNIQNYSFLNLPDVAQEHKPDLIELNNFFDDMQLTFKDYALDKKHPGIETHRLQSEHLYSIITL